MSRLKTRFVFLMIGPLSQVSSDSSMPRAVLTHPPGQTQEKARQRSQGYRVRAAVIPYSFAWWHWEVRLLCGKGELMQGEDVHRPVPPISRTVYETQKKPTV